jgi:hypothetical protein
MRKWGDPPSGGAESGALANFARYDPRIDVGLVTVIQAWPDLPEAIRKGILALVRAVE